MTIYGFMDSEGKLAAQGATIEHAGYVSIPASKGRINIVPRIQYRRHTHPIDYTP
jgi:hypothetical protein